MKAKEIEKLYKEGYISKYYYQRLLTALKFLKENGFNDNPETKDKMFQYVLRNNLFNITETINHHLKKGNKILDKFLSISFAENKKKVLSYIDDYYADDKIVYYGAKDQFLEDDLLISSGDIDFGFLWVNIGDKERFFFGLDKYVYLSDNLPSFVAFIYFVESICNGFLSENRTGIEYCEFLITRSEGDVDILPTKEKYDPVELFIEYYEKDKEEIKEELVSKYGKALMREYIKAGISGSEHILEDADTLVTEFVYDFVDNGGITEKEADDIILDIFEKSETFNDVLFDINDEGILSNKYDYQEVNDVADKIIKEGNFNDEKFFYDDNENDYYAFFGLIGRKARMRKQERRKERLKRRMERAKRKGKTKKLKRLEKKIKRSEIRLRVLREKQKRKEKLREMKQKIKEMKRLKKQKCKGLKGREKRKCKREIRKKVKELRKEFRKKRRELMGGSLVGRIVKRYNPLFADMRVAISLFYNLNLFGYASLLKKIKEKYPEIYKKIQEKHVKLFGFDPLGFDKQIEIGATRKPKILPFIKDPFGLAKKLKEKAGITLKDEGEGGDYYFMELDSNEYVYDAGATEAKAGQGAAILSALMGFINGLISSLFKKDKSLEDEFAGEVENAQPFVPDNEIEDAEKEIEAMRMKNEEEAKRTQRNIVIGITFGILILSAVAFYVFKQRQK